MGGGGSIGCIVCVCVWEEEEGGSIGCMCVCGRRGEHRLYVCVWEEGGSIGCMCVCGREHRNKTIQVQISITIATKHPPQPKQCLHLHK